MINQLSFWKKCVLAAVLPISAAHAEIIIHGTRVIYPSDAREITLQVSNSGEKPSLVQAWIDNGDAQSTPDQSKVPFMITPPISRVDPNKGQSLRITALPNAAQLSQTQETLYWLNVLDIPPKPTSKNQKAEDSDNFLQLAIRSRIKFFYRPAGMKENAEQAPTKLQWKIQANTLEVKNPTPFHITLTSVLQQQGAQRIETLPEGLMLKPFSSEKIVLKTTNTAKMTFTTINDFGGRVEHNIKLQ